jgi:hypothetical protein
VNVISAVLTTTAPSADNLASARDAITKSVSKAVVDVKSARTFLETANTIAVAQTLVISKEEKKAACTDVRNIVE